MVHVTLGRRAVLRAVALFLGRPPAPEDTDKAVLLLHRRRLLLLEVLQNESAEAKVAELCDLRDVLANEISRLPTPSLAVARIKLAIVLEEYVEPHCVDGFDLRLLRQVETWMRNVDEQGMTRRRSL